ncbi:MAG: NAD(P)/FAD-dependent oxidoreductase [Methanomicrobiales archaeon]|nr:NAD(P)/FAD-dependent oxidoreductase [Methanomicrobiales archaeon]
MRPEPGQSSQYDLVVIGTGNAGMHMALKARQSGWRVAIVDELPYGGTCAVKGCIPKKVLVGATEVIKRVDAMQDRGIAGSLQITWSDLIQFKRTFIDPVPATRERILMKEGIDTYHGHTCFLGKNIIQVGETQLSTRFIGIATGAIPRRLGIPGEQWVSSSDEFLAMDSLPEKLLFIGGGFISFELAQVAAIAGAQVTILHRSGRVLKEFDPFLVDMLVEAMKIEGIKILTDMPVLSIQKSPDCLQVLAGKDERKVFETDMVVHGAGRVPNLSGLGLDAGEVTTDAHGIVVNQYLQSVSNPSVYVAGDANAKGKPLSPVAIMEGRAAATNMVQGNTIAPKYLAVPSVVFVFPLLASVGWREDQLIEQGVTPVVYRRETSDWYSSRRIGLSRSGYKIFTEGEGGRIMGAHILGYNADEVINVFALAIQHGLTLKDLQEMVWAYPTGAFDINRIQLE